MPLDQLYLDKCETLFTELYINLDIEIPETSILRRNDNYLMIKANPNKNLHRDWLKDDNTEFLKNFIQWFEGLGEFNIPVTLEILNDYRTSLFDMEKAFKRE